MSKTYYYIRHQSGGCDYTINCGTHIEIICAKSKQDAIKQIIGLPENWKTDLEDDIDKFNDYICGSGLNDVNEGPYSQNIVEAELIEVANSIDMIPILKAKLAEINAFKKELADKFDEAAELKKYEQLKAKFENKKA